jgi:type III secretory pathway component EscV
MFITFFVPLGFFLLLAARKPREYRTVIAFAASQSLAHSAFQSQFLKQFGKGVICSNIAIEFVNFCLLTPINFLPLFRQVFED